MLARLSAVTATILLVGSPLARGQAPAAPVTAEADPGVRLTRLIDRAEVRLSRIELQPGAVRRVHAHDDVVYHLWVPVTGSLEITIGADAPVAAASGQAFFMKRGTPHGFRNVGATPAALFEIFIKDTTIAAAAEPLDLLAALLAGIDPGDGSGAPDRPSGGSGPRAFPPDSPANIR